MTKTIDELKKEFTEKTGAPWGDELEFAKDQIVRFDFPKAKKRYYLVYDSFTASIEEAYYWIINNYKYDLGLAEIEKITDSFGSSEHSTFFGVAQQRMGIQQDKVSQFMGIIGKMIKELFQIVRELRIIDERIELYYKSKKVEGITGIKIKKEEWDKERTPESEGDHEITVKGLYVDMAEGGAKNPASVFGLAQNLQYTTLPDLFFTIHPATDKEVTTMVDSLEFNKNVKWVLKRKLVSYMKWKKNTFKELLARKVFQVKYLRQHWNSIRMYIGWVKPYLRNISKMKNDTRKSDSADLISIFEGSLAEIEVIAKHMPDGNNEVFSCISSHFEYRTSPEMNFHAEGYQRAPLHIGEIKITLRGYTWTQEEIDLYKKIRSMEDLELAISLEDSLKDAMDALGGDVEKYLIEAEEDIDTSKSGSDPTARPQLPGILDPFAALFSNFKAPFNAFSPGPAKKKSPGVPEKERKQAEIMYGFKIWLTYKNFKKAHKMIQW